MKGFLSDNTASVHPNVLKKLMEVNKDHAYPYGCDEVTKEAKQKISEVFDGCFVTFVLNGTGANVIGLNALIDSYHCVICPDTGHINVDECGSFEKITGAKLVTLATDDGKLTVDMIKPLLQVKGNEHHSQPKVISISQVTECGTVYSEKELRVLADFAHDNDMYLHVDGARIAGAVVSENSSFKSMIKDTGVDMLSFGGAKNGLMYGEAIVCFDEKIHDKLKFYRKQSTQLMSKMRYISAQYLALLEDELWRKNAENANDMMKILVDGIKELDFINIDYEVQSNILFMTLDKDIVDKIKQFAHFNAFEDLGDKYRTRFVTSFDTTKEEVDELVKNIMLIAN